MNFQKAITNSMATQPKYKYIQSQDWVKSETNRKRKAAQRYRLPPNLDDMNDTVFSKRSFTRSTIAAVIIK